jgi:hypothetical protein
MDAEFFIQITNFVVQGSGKVGSDFSRQAAEEVF